MHTRFVSDIHLDPERPQTLKKFGDYLHGIQHDTDTLYILGDLFEYWIGDDGIDLLGHRQAAQLLSGISKSGIEIRVMHGNRDFLIGNQFVSLIGAELIADPCVVDVHGVRVLLTHGDTLCTDDADHQQFRQMVNSHEWQASFLSLPIEQRRDQALKMRAQSESGKSGKSMSIMDVNQHAVLKAMERESVATIIHGHVHMPAVYEHTVRGNAATRYVLGDWDSGRDGVVSVSADGAFSLHTPGSVLAASVNP